MQRTTQKDELRRFRSLRAASTPADREAVIKRYLPLARGLAARYGYAAEPVEDLEQVAAIGLLNAIDRFDPDRGIAFTSFAVPTILGELRRHFRDHTWALRVPRNHQELLLKLEKARDDLATSLGRQPTVAELSCRLEVDPELVLQLADLSLARRALPLPLDRADSESGDAPGDIDDGYSRVEDRAWIAQLLEGVSARDAQIILLRFNADLTQDAIAHRLSVSQMYVSRALRRALERLHAEADDDGPNGRHTQN